MATSMFLDEPWSDDESAGSNDNDGLLTGHNGYVSLTRLEQHSEALHTSLIFAEQEHLRRSPSTTNAPKLYNFNLKKSKYSSHAKIRSRMNEKHYVSLFPIIDKFILYYPTYNLLRGGSKCKHYSILTIYLAFVLWTIFEQCITVGSVYFDATQPTYNITRGIFYLILFLNPYIGSICRFYFFYFNFDWAIWRKKRKIQPPSTVCFHAFNQSIYLILLFSVLIFSLLQRGTYCN